MTDAQTQLHLDVQALRASVVPPRSRHGRLFGVTAKDLDAARERLIRVLAASTDDRPVTATDVIPSTSAGQADAAIAEAGKPAHEGEEAHQRDPATRDVGYSGSAASTAAGITYRQLDNWTRTGLIRPNLRSGNAPEQRTYSLQDVVLLRVIKSLLDADLSLQTIRPVVENLQRRRPDELQRMTLLSAGNSIVTLIDTNEVDELSRLEAGDSGIVLRVAWHEVEEALAEQPTNPAVSTDAPDTAHPRNA